MKGPKKFTVAERDEIECHTRSLEEALSDMNDAAVDLCQKRNNRTRSYENKLNQCLQDLEVDDCLKVHCSVKPFSPYSPRVKFKDNLHVDVREYIDQRVDEVLSADELSEVRRVEAEYSVEMSRFNREYSRIVRKQETLHAGVLSLTLVEMPFMQKDIRDKVVLYVSDPYEQTLVEARIDLREGRYFVEPRRTNFPNVNIRKRSSAEIRHIMKFQARLNQANVYYAHNFCKDITADEILFEVKAELQRLYDSENPDVVRERIQRMQAEARKRADMKAMKSRQHDMVARQVLFTQSKGRKYAIVDSSGQVSPNLDLDELLDDERWKVLLFDPYDRN